MLFPYRERQGRIDRKTMDTRRGKVLNVFRSNKWTRDWSLRGSRGSKDNRRSNDVGPYETARTVALF